METGNFRQESLEESQERYRAFLRNSQEGIWRVELDKPISTKLPVRRQIALIHKYAYFAEANLAMAKMFGFPSVKPLIGTRLVDVVKAHPDSAPLTAFIQNSYRLSDVETLEKDRNGKNRYFRHSLTGIVEGGYLVRAWGTQQDVTEQRLAQLAQAKSDTRLKLALKATDTGIWEWDVNTNELTWSDELKLIFGLKPEGKITFKKYLKLVHPEDRGGLQQTINTAASDGKSFQVEHRIIRPDGSLHWVFGLGKAFVEYGRISYMMGTSMLIDDRKQYEANLVESESRFRNLADSAPVLIWMSALDGTSSYVNKHWQDFTGRTLKQELGTGWIQGVHPDDRDRILKIYAKAFKKREPFGWEFRLRRHDGEYRWLVNNGVPRFSMDGEFLGYIGSSTDIGDIKVAIRRNAELEVFNAQLLELSSAKDEFISIASHQLRTPATIVKQYIGMVQDGFAGDLNEEQQNMLHVAYISNERQINIINDLLKVANIDAGKVILNLSKCNIVELIQEVLDEQEQKFKERKQNVTFSYVQKNTSVNLDKRLLRMVFENIIDNASKYSPGDAKIDIGVKTEQKNVVVTVKDTGIGIDIQDQDKLFQKFSRIQNHLTAGIEGTGLGLYWSKKIVDLHGGDIRLRSSLGKGSKFTVYLPLKPKKVAPKRAG